MVSKSVYFLVLLLCFSVLLVPINSEVGVCDAASEDDFDNAVMRFGVNYFSTHNHYEPYYLQDEELDRDFALFCQQGLEYVSLAIVWTYHEPQLGEYNEQALDDIIRVCDFAAKYDLKVVINFYTMMTEGGWWTMPTWLSPRDFETVFTNETAHTAWLNFLDHCASRLNATSNIWSWHMMNEPARVWGANVTIEEYLDLWSEMKSIFKSYSDRLVSVRFAAQVFDNPIHFNHDPRIYNLLDYLALNWYENHCTRETLTQIVTEAQEQTNIFISEFGYSTSDDAEQAANYASYIVFFKSLQLTDCVAWMWRADYNLGNPDLPGVNYNLAKDVDGTPRPAFYLLTPQADVSVTTDRGRYVKWSYVRIAVTVTDKLNGTLLQNASVDLTVYDTHKRAVWFATATTNADGKATFTYKLVFNAQMGTYTINATASLNGYSTANGQTTFYSLG